MREETKKRAVFNKIVKYLLLTILAIGISFGVYSYFKAGEDIQPIQEIQKIEQQEIKDEGYKPDKAEKEYLQKKFKELKEINSDVIAYMYVPGDGEDSLKEPILQTTNNSKYLVTDIYNKPSNLIGAVFMDYENNSSFAEKDIKWIFGHARGGIEEKRIILDTRVFNNINWFGKKDYFDIHRVIVIETPERKYYYEVTGVSVVNENTELYQLPNNSEDKQIFINKFKASSKNWLSDTKISGDDNMAVFATCRLDNVYLRSLVLARQIPDSELKNFLEKYKDLLNS